MIINLIVNYINNNLNESDLKSLVKSFNSFLISDKPEDC